MNGLLICSGTSRSKNDYKMQNIAHILGMDNRLIPYNNKNIPANAELIDYKEVYGKLRKHRERSNEYIDRYIINKEKMKKLPHPQSLIRSKKLRLGMRKMLTSCELIFCGDPQGRRMAA